MSPTRTGNARELRWHVYPTPAELAEALAADIAVQAARAVDARGRYSIVVPGGNTPKPLFARLAQIETDWRRWLVLFTDERCVPAGHADRNDAMARSAWLDHVPIPPAGILSIPAELGADGAAAAYARTVADLGTFDTAVLGLGEDGHTASLFPGADTGLAPDAPDALPVHDSPKPPAERVTLSARRLADARRVVLLATGAGKRDAVARLHGGEPIPAAAIRPAAGLDIWLDAAAAGDGD